MYGTCHVRFLSSFGGLLGALCKISDLKIFKRVHRRIVFIHFEPQTYVNHGGGGGGGGVWVFFFWGLAIF